jgi:hypothetical protein
MGNCMGSKEKKAKGVQQIVFSTWEEFKKALGVV